MYVINPISATIFAGHFNDMKNLSPVVGKKENNTQITKQMHLK